MLFDSILSNLRESLARIPEHRRGKNIRYRTTDAGLAAFGVFFMQSPSSLAHQRDMQRRKGENNACSLFEVKDIPSDAQIRSSLDPLDAAQLKAVFSGEYMRNWMQVGIWTSIKVSGTHG